MSSSLYEIVELANGDIALRRSDDDSEPLVVIHFSEESLQALREGRFQVAKAMIEAGMEAASDIEDPDLEMHEQEHFDEGQLRTTERVLH